ncbi:DUF3096 domain-containing protein [Candidatus Methanomassiliicoccus intestinalis]|uniref:DUF3096 domain-containing protein n=1 Tax=Candidatus Methanomassiliicoccus intestinalis TaxID=1406512 RepID=UPI0037DC71DC
MNLSPWMAIISIIFGILVIVFRDLLNWIVGIFLIIWGLWTLYEKFIAKKEN